MSDHSREIVVQYKSLSFLGFPKYKVGDDGSIWRLWKATRGWVKIKASKGGGGLRRKYSAWGITLCKQGIPKRFLIHRLVLLAFIGPCPESMEACHNDGNRDNNQLRNLRWDTHKNNCADRAIHKTNTYGSKNAMAKLEVKEVLAIRILYESGKFTQREIGDWFDVARVTVKQIVNRTRWKHIE